MLSDNRVYYKDNIIVYKNDIGYSISKYQCWCEGLFDSVDTALESLNYNCDFIQKLQTHLNNTQIYEKRIITMDMLKNKKQHNNYNEPL